MNKNGVRIGVVVISLVVGMVFLLATQFPPLWSFLSPRPPKPEIKYGEFAFRLEYEQEGETIIVEDVVIAEYGGISWNAGSGNDNVWKSRLKSGNEAIELYRDETDVLFINILRILSGSYLLENSPLKNSLTQGDRHRELPDVTKVSLRDKDLSTYYDEGRATFFSENVQTNWQAFDEAYWYIDEDELFDTYGIRLISFECDPPIENSFKYGLLTRMLEVLVKYME